MMRMISRSACHSVALAFLLAPLAVTGAAKAGGYTPCDSPFIFGGAAANVAPIEYLATSADKGADDRLSALQETAQRLAWLIKLDSWHQPTYGSLGVVAHMFLGRRCDPDEVLERLLLHGDAGGPMPPGQILILAQGKIFIEGELIFLQTRLRGFRRNREEPKEGQQLAQYFMWEGIDAALRGEAYRLVAVLPELDITFAPRAMTMAELEEIDRVFEQASRLYSEASEGASSEELTFIPNETRAFQVETVKEGEWLRIEDMQTGLSGYIRSDPEASRFLHVRMPELDFLNGMLGYLRVRQADSGLGDFAKPPAETADLARGSFQRFLESERTSDENESRALAAALMAALEVASRGDWAAARRELSHAVDLAPYRSEYRNMLGVANAHLCCAGSPEGEYGDPARDFSDALSLAPDNVLALNNLHGFLSRLSEIPSPPAGIDVSRLEERLEVVEGVIPLN